MKQAALKYFTDLDLSMLALMIFFLSFVFLIYRVYFFQKKESFEVLSQIPLNDKEVNHVQQ